MALIVEVIKLWQLANLSVSLFFQMERVGSKKRGQALFLGDSILLFLLKMIPVLVGDVPARSRSQAECPSWKANGWVRRSSGLRERGSMHHCNITLSLQPSAQVLEVDRVKKYVIRSLFLRQLPTRS